MLECLAFKGVLVVSSRSNVISLAASTEVGLASNRKAFHREIGGRKIQKEIKVAEKN